MPNRFLLAMILLAVVSLACIAPAGFVVTGTPPVDSVKVKAPAATTENLLAIVTAFQSLNVRQHPGEYERVIGYLYHDESVTLTGACRNGWAEIAWKSGTAWVNADFLSKNKCSEEK